jgi:hypothetical protein
MLRFFITFSMLIPATAFSQAWLEVDEGAGHYDYIEKEDSTWIHWGTSWTIWTTAEVWVDANGYGVSYPSIWVHDAAGSTKHLSTSQQLSWHHFPSANWKEGASLDYYLKLNGSTLAIYADELMIVDVQKQDITGYITNTPKQLVLQFAIDAGTNAGRELNRLWVQNDGSLREGNGTDDINYNQVKLYYETGSSFSFNGNESSESLYGDFGGDPTNNNLWGNNSFASGAGIPIPSDGSSKLFCYVVIENFNSTLTPLRTAQFKITTDGMNLDQFGGLNALGLVRIDEKRNSEALPLSIIHVANANASSNGDYLTLKAAFDAINAQPQAGNNIVVTINGSTSETASAVLNENTSPWNSLVIYPTAAGYAIGGNLAAPLIELNGADHVTFDGRVNQSGTTADLTLTQTGTNSSSRTIYFINAAENNVVRYCNVQGACPGAGSGVIFFSTSTSGNGNDNNTIEYCNITNSGSRPLNVICSSGSAGSDNSGNTVSNNHVFDFFNPGYASNGIYLEANSSSWTITGNSFYETASFAPTAAVDYNMIRISNTVGNNFTITGNYLGGSAPLCGGSAWTKTNANTNLFFGIYFDVASSTGSSIQGNFIQNFNWSNSGAADWTGVYIADGAVNIGTVTGNTIGAATGTGSISVSNAGSADADVIGIRHQSSGTDSIQNNTIGSITTASNTTFPTNFYGIYKSGGSGTLNISNNFIGSAITSNSIHASSAVTGNAQFVYGISNTAAADITITGNTIANMTNAYNGSGAGATAGINFTGGSGNNTVSKNFIYGLSSTNNAPDLFGIRINGGAGTYSNNIVNLGATVNANCNIYGIYENSSLAADIYFNTVYIGGTVSSGSKSTYGIYNAGNTNSRNLRNNIFYSNRSGAGSYYAIRLAGTTTLTIDYNDYFTSGTGGTLGAIAGTNYPTLAAWKGGTGLDVNSLSVNPGFVSAGGTALTDYIPSATTFSGTAIPGIPDDIDGTTRCLPSIGAQENTTAVGTPGIPVPSASTICQGSPKTYYTTSAANASSYNWTISGAGLSIISGSGPTGTVTWDAGFTGTATISVTANGCGGLSAAASTTVTVNPAAPATILAGGPTTFCEGDSVVLTASAGSSYLWSKGETTQAIIVSISGPYTVAVTYANGCSAVSVPTIVTVNPNPTAVIISPDSASICIGSIQRLVSSGGLKVYNCGTQANLNTASGNLATDYPAPYTIVFGGQRMQMLIRASELTAAGFSNGSGFISIQFPVVSLGSGWGTTVTSCNSFKVSIGNTALTKLSDFQNGLTTVVAPADFTPAIGYDNIHSFSSPFPWDGTSNIIIETTFSNSIGGDSDIAVYQYYSPTDSVTTRVYRADFVTPAQAAAAAPAPGAVYDSYRFRPDFRLNGKSIGAGNVKWSPNTALYTDAAATNAYTTGALLDTVYAKPSATMIYTARSTSGAGCTSSDSVKVTVNALPAAVITPGGPTTFCAGGSVVLTASGGTGYVWSNAATTAAITVLSSGTYTVTVSDANSCDGTASVAVAVNPLPVVTAPSAVCVGSTITLSPVTGGTWTSSDVAIATVTNGGIVTGVAAGTVTFTFTETATGCSNTTTSVTVNPLPATSTIYHN